VLERGKRLDNSFIIAFLARAGSLLLLLPTATVALMPSVFSVGVLCSLPLIVHYRLSQGREHRNGVFSSNSVSLQIIAFQLGSTTPGAAPAAPPLPSINQQDLDRPRTDQSNTLRNNSIPNVPFHSLPTHTYTRFPISSRSQFPVSPGISGGMSSKDWICETGVTLAAVLEAASAGAVLMRLRPSTMQAPRVHCPVVSMRTSSAVGVRVSGVGVCWARRYHIQRGSWRERPTSLERLDEDPFAGLCLDPAAEYSDKSLVNVAVRKADVHSARGLPASRKGAMKVLKSE
jgi:hypothetical protein